MRKKIIVVMLLMLTFISNAYSLSETFDYQNIFQNNKIIIIIVDPSTAKIIDANKAAEEFYGYTREELINMDGRDINQSPDEEIKIIMEKVSKNKNNFVSTKHKLKDGSIRDVEVYSSFIDGKERDKKLFSIVHDVTDRNLAEKELAKQKKWIFYFLGALILVLLISILVINKAKKEEAKIKDKYITLFENMEEGFALHEIVVNDEGIPIDYIFLEMNNAFEKITGLKAKNIKNKRIKEVLPDTEDHWIENYGKVALTGESMSFPNYSVEVDKHFNVNVYSPSLNKFITVFTDITSEKKAQEKLVEERNLFETTIDSIGDGVISTDADGNIKIMNKVAEKLTGWEISEAIGLPFQEIFNIINEVSNEPCENPLDKVIKKGEVVDLEKDTLLIKKNREKIAIEDSAAPIKDEKGNIKGAVVVFRDFTEQKERQEKIKYLSYHDNITGLYNRHFLEEEINRLDVERNLPLTIGMLDVNGLKMVNDVFGHEAGDRLLKIISEVLKEQCRADDIIARLGGDEFIILLPGTSSEDTEIIMNRIHKALEEKREDNFILSLSTGWSTKEDIKQDIKDIIMDAENHMYRKKIIETQIMRNETINLILEKFHRENPEEKIHSEKVSELSLKIGRKMKVSEEKIEELLIAGLMHDIGKSMIEKSILNKKEKLTNAEWEKIKRHPEIGYRILKSADAYASAAEVILSHHERWDGSGYPRKLKEEKIPFSARIIAVAEAWVDMREEKAFMGAYSREEAIEELKRGSGSQFDPEIVKFFLEHLPELDK